MKNPTELDYSDKNAFEAHINQCLAELRRLSWEYSQRHGPLRFLLDGPATGLPAELLEGAKILHHRHEISRFAKRGGVFCEIGTWHGAFAKHLIDTCQPQKIFTIDLTYKRFKYDVMQQYLDSGALETIEGDSSTQLGLFPDDSFDMLYIDGDHSRKGIEKDIAAGHKKVRPGGLLVFNDYVNWSVFQFEKYGTVVAANNFANEHRWNVEYLALDTSGYCDIAFRRPG